LQNRARVDPLVGTDRHGLCSRMMVEAKPRNPVHLGPVHQSTQQELPMSTSVYCLANSDVHANAIVNVLKREGFRVDDISVLFPDLASTRDFAHEKHTKAPEGAATGGATGGVLGGALGWMAGIGLLAIPGIGPFIAAGPILAGLSGAAIGAAVGGLTGGLIGMGMPEYEAKRYEGKIREGRVLISVHADNSEWASKVKTIFKDAQAEDIGSSGEASAPIKSHVGEKKDRNDNDDAARANRARGSF